MRRSGLQHCVLNTTGRDAGSPIPRCIGPGRRRRRLPLQFIPLRIRSCRRRMVHHPRHPARPRHLAKRRGGLGAVCGGSPRVLMACATPRQMREDLYAEEIPYIQSALTVAPGWEGPSIAHRRRSSPAPARAAARAIAREASPLGILEHVTRPSGSSDRPRDRAGTFGDHRFSVPWPIMDVHLTDAITYRFDVAWVSGC
jgi:hypothetical protein